MNAGDCVYLTVDEDDHKEFSVTLGDGRILNINVTHEGVIMDVFERRPEYADQDEHLGTAGMMFDEWADWVDARRAAARIDSFLTDCRHCGQRIHLQGVYVDGTGGDVCCADKFTEKNENGEHQP